MPLPPPPPPELSGDPHQCRAGHLAAHRTPSAARYTATFASIDPVAMVSRVLSCVVLCCVLASLSSVHVVSARGTSVRVHRQPHKFTPLVPGQPVPAYDVHHVVKLSGGGYHRTMRACTLRLLCCFTFSPFWACGWPVVHIRRAAHDGRLLRRGPDRHAATDVHGAAWYGILCVCVNISLVPAC